MWLLVCHFISLSLYLSLSLSLFLTCDLLSHYLCIFSFVFSFYVFHYIFFPSPCSPAPRSLLSAFCPLLLPPPTAANLINHLNFELDMIRPFQSPGGWIEAALTHSLEYIKQVQRNTARFTGWGLERQKMGRDKLVEVSNNWKLFGSTSRGRELPKWSA